MTVSPPPGPVVFPLRAEAGKRYLVDATGAPFFIHGDTPWMIVNQLTNAEIDTYLDDRQAKGFTALMIEAPGQFFTSQTPVYDNVDGEAPFNTMSPVDWASPNDTFWDRVDYFVDGCKARGIVVFFQHSYLGFLANEQGWANEISAESDADLQTYGAFLANRYTQGNVIWVAGGDYVGTVSERDKQWQIHTGIRSVRTTDIMTGHAGPTESSYMAWNSYTGYNFNTAYPSDEAVYTHCLTEYARAGPMPVVMLEAIYEQERGSPISAAGLLRQSYQAILSGCHAGQFFANNPLWHFESPNTLFSYSGTWESNLDSTGSTQQQYVKDLFDAYQWWLLEPKTDTSLVTTSLGSGNSRVTPARASDGSFAMIWSPGVNFTVAMSALTPSSVRARWYNPTDGSYSSAGGPFANSGTQTFNPPADRVLVLDAA